MRRLAVAALALAAAACATHRGQDAIPTGDGPLIGVYRAAIDDGSGGVRRVKLLLWAERPDKLHAELLAPVGGVSAVLDAGGGRACLVDVGASTAYAGGAGPSVLESLAGVRVSIADAVAAILTGAPVAGLRVERVGGADGELPERLVLADGARSLALTRLRFTRGTSGGSALGTGAPPPRMSVRPIEELPHRPADTSTAPSGSR